jgi:hypothetical protein
MFLEDGLERYKWVLEKAGEHAVLERWQWQWKVMTVNSAGLFQCCNLVRYEGGEGSFLCRRNQEERGSSFCKIYVHVL